MITESQPRQHTVTLFLRAHPEMGCEQRKRAVLERLDALDAAGQIQDYDVHIWSKEISVSGPLEGTSYYQHVFEHVSAFQQWARSHSVELNVAFKLQSLECEITDETFQVLTLPSICLAVYENNDLAGVYPHVDGEQVRTINDGLETLEASAQLEYAD